MELHREEIQEPGQFFPKVHTTLLIYPMRRQGPDAEPEVRNTHGQPNKERAHEPAHQFAS